jgi:PqqD family protein of HPr-rel-A system
VTARLYRADYPQHCRTHAIDGMTLVFHRPSATTHFLSSPAPEMLVLLSGTSISAIELCRKLCDQFDAPYDDEALFVVEARLDELVASGLVRLG